MTVTITHVLIGIAVSVAVLGFSLYLAWRNTRPAFPVHCVHCWVKEDRETVVTYSPQPHLWAICPDCVRHYWEVDAPGTTTDTAPFNRSEQHSPGPMPGAATRAGISDASLDG